MKKCDFYITIRGTEKWSIKARKVSGYSEFFKGSLGEIEVAFHKNDFGTWNATDKSSGLRLKDGKTRNEVVSKITEDLVDAVIRARLNGDNDEYIRVITEAYEKEINREVS